MSVDFTIKGQRIDWDGDEPVGDWINVANANAHDIFHALGIISPELIGEIRAKDLLSRCEAYLTHPTAEAQKLGYIEGRVIQCGRRPGYISEKITALRDLAIKAGELGVIRWS